MLSVFSTFVSPIIKMITFKPIVKPSGKRKDGTWLVRIRVTFNRQVRWLPTNLVCTPADLTRSGKIRNATILEKAADLISEMRATVDSLSVFDIDSWTVDDVVRHIRAALTKETWRLDFFEFADGFLDSKRTQTRRLYDTALNAFAAFLGRRECDVNAITRRMLLDFVKWYEQQPAIHRNADGSTSATGHAKVPAGASSMYVAKLAHIYAGAKWQYNDEDAGLIRIPRSPFDGLRKAYPAGQGQRNLGVDIVQRLIDAEPQSPIEDLARAAFLVSFGLMGANMADLWEERKTPDGLWVYNRRKTASRRADRAEVRVHIPEQIAPFLERLCANQGQSEWWLTELHQWANENTATARVNQGLRSWAEREGVEPFTFYAARHTWATLARGLGIEKATVDEALAHVGDYRIADIYAERNWALAWEANRRVLDLFSWPTS